MVVVPPHGVAAYHTRHTEVVGSWWTNQQLVVLDSWCGWDGGADKACTSLASMF